MAGRRRQRVEHTEDWEQLRLLVKWPEQERYEEIRPLVLFGDSVFERTEETRTSERTLYRRVESFERDGVESLFATERARRKVLPPWIRGLIVNLKAEYPPFNLNEIANVVYVHSGRKPDVRTVRNVLEGSARRRRRRRGNAGRPLRSGPPRAPGSAPATTRRSLRRPGLSCAAVSRWSARRARWAAAPRPGRGRGRRRRGRSSGQVPGARRPAFCSHGQFLRSYS